jgi:hypothetical protein
MQPSTSNIGITREPLHFEHSPSILLSSRYSTTFARGGIGQELRVAPFGQLNIALSWLDICRDNGDAQPWDFLIRDDTAIRLKCDGCQSKSQ